MAHDLGDLKRSNEFLNLLLDHAGAAVLLVDEASRVHRFNNSLPELAGGAESAGQPFGRAMGCIHSLRENKACGDTTACNGCAIHRLIRKTMERGVPMERNGIEQYFHEGGRFRKKILNVSTRNLAFQDRKLVLVLFRDVTETEMARAALERDLEAAAAIRRSLLPDRACGNDQLRFAWQSQPCATIGGDIFNICHLDARHIGLYMLDVCGHGVSAAFLSIAISQFLKNNNAFRRDETGGILPGNVLSRLNRNFPFERFDSFFTIVYAVIDLADGTLSYSSAGHPPPVLLRGNDPRQLPGRHGPAIGLAPDTRYDGGKEKLERGDKVVLYTDGILDSRNASGEPFGKEAFFDLLHEHGGAPVKELVDGVYTHAVAFANRDKNEDDISILGIEYRG